MGTESLRRGTSTERGSHCWRRNGLVLLVAVAVLASCGGDAGDGEASSPDQAVAVAEGGTGDAGAASESSLSYGSVFRVAFDVTDRFGGPGGYAATATALDRGYTLRQLVDSHADLDRDGWIVVDGEERAPDGSPQKLLGPAPEADESESDGEGDPMLQTPSLKQQTEREEYVEFVGETLGEMWVRIEGRAKWGVSGEEVDRFVDDAIERSRIDAEFDALFAAEPDEMDQLHESEVLPTAFTLMLVGQGYSLEDALEAALLGSFEVRGRCLLIPGAARATALRMDGCELVDIDDSAAGDEPDESADTAAQGADEQIQSPGGLVDSGKTTWNGDMTPKPDSLASVTVGDNTVTREYPVTYPEGFAEITRLPGTDDFTISIDVTVDSAKDYALSGKALEELLAAGTIDGFHPNFCETSTNTTFNGVGTFDGDTSADRYFIVFRGEQQTIEVRNCELEALDPYENVRESEVWVEVSADGLRVDFSPYEVVFDGPAALLAG